MIGDISECACIVEEFVIESSEGVGVAIDDVLSLEQGHDHDAIDRIFRVVHSIKGTATMLNFVALAEFVHSLEDICSDIRSGHRTVDRRVADGLLKCLDFIQFKLDGIRGACREDEDYSQGNEYLRLLREEPHPEDGVVCRHRDEAVGLPVPNGGGTPSKTLIVEADFMVRKVLYSSLSKYTTCHLAKDGSEAIQAVTESYMGPHPQPFSLILMDIALPTIDGFQATRAIRSLELAKGAKHAHDEARIVMISSANESGNTSEAIHDCGADSYMAGPLDLRTLQQLCVRRPSCCQDFGQGRPVGKAVRLSPGGTSLSSA